VLLVLSISANWIQDEALETDWVVKATDEILDTPEVREALAIYTVDQLYANIDVEGEIEARCRSRPSRLPLPPQPRSGSWRWTSRKRRSPRLAFRASFRGPSEWPTSGSSP
jgi:hypothetical protein